MTSTDANNLSLAALRDPALRANPYPFYAQLRSHAPVHWDTAAGMDGGWVLTRHADVMAALRDPRVSAERLEPPQGTDWLPAEYREAAQQVFRTMPHQLLFLDPPDHTRLRGLLSKAFTPRLVEAWRPRIVELANELLDPVQEAGQMDVIASLAYPLPAIVIAELLGVPPADREQFIRWSSDFGGFLDGSTLTAQEALQALQGVADFMAYFRGIIARRHSAPRDDLLQALLTARERDDALTEDELLANLVLLLAAGHGTTTHLIGNGLLALLRHPEQWQRLCESEHPGLIATAVAELLRFDSPVQLTGRRVREELTISGVTLAAGQHITTILGAANRDPDQFPDPNRLDVGRAENRQLSFGYGIHFCLGAPLAKLEAEIALSAVTRRLPRLRLADGAASALEWQPSIVFRGLRSLPVVCA
ncbi:MAG TPA: cytochrome P450 [Ktedonobacterales bacterium]|nr:cytochrome P450 [Ktedonobacterales bacterium]